jgi:hypothetical protein
MRSDTCLFALVIGCAGPSDTGPGAVADPDHTADRDETGDTDTAAPDPCPEPIVRFEHTDGSVDDVTASLLSGDYLTLDQPGRLLVCPGTWFARLLLRADIDVVGLGAAAADTVLSGGESGTILDVAGPDVTASVTHVTLDRGAGLDEAHNSGGGGLYCAEEGTIAVEDVVFSHNGANDGAGLYARNCEVWVTGASFVDNVSEDDGGSFTLWYSNATIDEVSFTGNTGLDGGAMAMFYSTAAMTNVTFDANTSSHFAGALWVYNSSLAMSDSTFTDNVNTGGDAGALLFHGTGTLDRVDFSGNTGVRGGGLFVYWESEVAGTDCSFAGNTPEDIFAADYSDAGGVSYTAGAGYSFSCTGNACVGG